MLPQSWSGAMFMRLYSWLLLILFQCGLSLMTAALSHGQSEPRYPSPGGVWSASQYTIFHFVHVSTNLALPHLRTPESRALFERLIDTHNIETIVAANAGRSQRQHEIRRILAAMGGIRGAYNLAVTYGEPLQEELTRVQIFNLYLVAEVAALADGPIADANCSSSMRTTFQGVVRSLSEGEVYSPAQTAALAEAAARRYPPLASLFSDAERRELIRIIELLHARQTDPPLRQSLRRLMLTVESH